MKNVVLTLAIAITGLALSGCNSSNNEEVTALREELVDVQGELRSLRQLKYEVENLEKDISSLQRKLAKAKSTQPRSGSNSEGASANSDSSNKKPPQGNDPIFPVTFSPSGSHKDDPFMGPKEAETLVMAFIDYQCQPCRKFYAKTFPKLREDYIDDGKLQFILRDFPLSSNSYSRKAAVLAHCAGEQGRYWEMHDQLFRQQSKIDFGEFSELIGSQDEDVNQRKLSRCFADSRYQKEINQDIEEGKSLGAKGAPGFFVGLRNGDGKYEGVFIRGAQPYPVIKAQIDKIQKNSQKLS